MTIFERLARVKAFVLDVDGVLTDGRVLVNESGEQWRSFHTRDGYAMQLAVKKQYPFTVISGGRSQGVAKRLQGLGIQDVVLDCSDKLSALKAWAKTKNLPLEEILFMGDDVPDLPLLKAVGLPCCPVDAIPDVQAQCVYVSPVKGGYGAVRDVLEKVMRLQQRWEDNDHIKSI